MITEIECHAEEIARLCRQFGVRRLEVFGSAASGGFDPARSDLDFLVSFEPAGASLFRRYFGLQEALERLFGRKVDLVSADALRNPYFIAEVARSRRTIYAAPFAEAA
ncbi:MAG: nucleotidyltransferase domain-containing protein [Rhodocyclaceae bacterium]|nr:nucleotidyltransferase domain-containing protein [Rhodocyclaceae bacterium]